MKRKPSHSELLRDYGVSFSLKGKPISRVNAEAAALGLSYGQYSALVVSDGIRNWVSYHKIDWQSLFQQISKSKRR